MKRFFVFAISAIGVLLISSAWIIGQDDTDSDPDIKVAEPAYVKKHPKVLFDEAHFNVHTSGGRSKAFADLIVNDGYQVIPNKRKFEPKNLKGIDILVISSAMGADREINPVTAGNPAFTEPECDAVKDWVRRGGNLLLITDHEPSGAAAQNLSNRFGVQMSNGTTYDSAPANHMKGCDGCIRFTRENGLLENHAVTRGPRFDRAD